MFLCSVDGYLQKIAAIFDSCSLLLPNFPWEIEATFTDGVPAVCHSVEPWKSNYSAMSVRMYAGSPVANDCITLSVLHHKASSTVEAESRWLWKIRVSEGYQLMLGAVLHTSSCNTNRCMVQEHLSYSITRTTVQHNFSWCMWPTFTLTMWNTSNQ